MAPMWMLTWLPLAAGLWMVFAAFAINTGNVQSHLLFRVFPLITGVLSLIAGAVNIGWLPVITG